MLLRVEIDVIEWNTLFTNWRQGANDPGSRGAHPTNVSFAAMDPFFAMVRFTSSKTVPPVSNNWGYFTSPEFDELIAKARTSFADKERDDALAALHARIARRRRSVDRTDVGPRAMSPKLKGVVQPRAGHRPCDVSIEYHRAPLRRPTTPERGRPHRPLHRGPNAT